MATTHQIEAFRQSWRPTQEKVDIAVRTAIDVARPSRVYLFGSWANGEATPDSDLDLAVVVPEQRRGEIPSLQRQLRQKLENIPMSIDLMVVPEDYFTRFLHSINSIYYKIAHEGKLVYEQSR